MAAIINDPEVKKLYPNSDEASKIKISYNLAPPIGVHMMNYTHLAKDPVLEAAQPPDISNHINCPCQAYKTSDSLEHKGHVVSTDPSFINDLRLKSMWLKGRKHRVQMHPEASLEGIKKGLQEFVSSAVKRLQIDEKEFAAWAGAIANAMEIKFTTMWNQSYSEKNTFLSKNGQAELQKLRSIMAICPVDKSSQDFGLCCRNLYLHELWHEIHSPHYEEAHMLENEDIWSKHAELSKKVHTRAVADHRYIYGSIKMHKTKIGFRWISGNHMNEVKENSTKTQPACSLSGPEAALGGVLRTCMKILEHKDGECRKKGYKRYWVVTNVDTVAAAIKIHKDKIKGSVFTRDFTRMYTSIPQERLIEKVLQPLREAFQWKSAETKIPFDDLRMDVKYEYNNHATAVFRHEGLSFKDIQELLEQVCTEVYFQQSAKGRIFRQKGGLPMGGKASAELANLYCYAIESAFIDWLISNDRMEEAKSWFNTWRYIDDMCGFGERKWEEMDYGMDHLDTTETHPTPTTPVAETVFLGMRIRTDPTGIHLTSEPKGRGWRWRPQRFIEFASCHTHYTKWYIYSSQLIRMSTITNSADAFFDGAIREAEALILRGFNKNAMNRAWTKYAYTRAKDFVLRTLLTRRFKAWVDEQDFSAAAEGDTEKKQALLQKRSEKNTRDLRCGLKALNAILSHIKKATVDHTVTDRAALELAKREEQLLYDKSVSSIRDCYHHPDGYYAIDVIINLIKEHAGIEVERAHGEELINLKGKIYLIASRNHYTCVIREEDGYWVEKDNGKTHPIVNLTHFLNARNAAGAVYRVGDQSTETRFDQKTTNGRERPTHSPAKEDESRGAEGKSPAPRKQKTDGNTFKPGEGQAYRDQTAPKPNQNKTTMAVNSTPIFGEEGNSFDFTATTEHQRNLIGAWRQGTRNSTPGKAAAAVYSMRNENTVPPSLGLGEPFHALLDNLTPDSMNSAPMSLDLLAHCSNGTAIDLVSQGSDAPPSEHSKSEPSESPAATPQNRVSQKSNISDAASVELFSQTSDAASVEPSSQRSNTSPSKDTHPERELNFEPTPERRSARISNPPVLFDVAQVQQDENARKKPEATKRYSPYPTGDP